MELTLDKVRNAQKNIEKVVRKTPLLYSSTFSMENGSNIYLKCENKQKTGAFKLRGAYNKITTLSEEEKSKGVLASSAGNHAQGVAYGATAFGIKSTIVMPNTAPQAKVQATKAYGAEVVQFGEVYDECYGKAVEIQKQSGATFIHPFDDVEVMAGQGTIALEILNDLPETDVIAVPIGGGGLISGIAVAAKELKPSVRIIGVQADIIASSKVSLSRGEIITLPGVKSLADGISVKTPGINTFKYMSKYVDDIVTVTEDEIAQGIFSLMERNKLVAEGAGAVPVAALLANKIKADGKNIVALVSGGNIDIAMISKIIDRQLILLHRRICFTVELQDKIGQMNSLISDIVSQRVNIVKASQNRNWDHKGLDYVKVQFEIEAQSKEHAEQLIGALIVKGYNITMVK